ncbi:hypothetical protein MesoLj113b_70970 (plasmid) [Mesorhizobium sp. 113-3-3]|nr:hypothetical protein MesoLj113b_70970 [Mesorhizobium sp. 113-3-3]
MSAAAISSEDNSYVVPWTVTERCTAQRSVKNTCGKGPPNGAEVFAGDGLEPAPGKNFAPASLDDSICLTVSDTKRQP